MNTSYPRLVSSRRNRSTAIRLAAVLFVVTACATDSLQAQASRTVPAQVAAALAARPQTPAAGNRGRGCHDRRVSRLQLPFLQKNRA